MSKKSKAIAPELELKRLKRALSRTKSKLDTHGCNVKQLNNTIKGIELRITELEGKEVSKVA